ncbi:protoporphyrinogen oxidase [Gemmatimonadetes bacterium T265]|nr:protoporphyrinogen oxidase [Gemmatimonadetes bacterium T265]
MLAHSDALFSTPGPHVVVVGGGVSGLAAAERITQSDATATVTVVEATARLGGMIHTEHSGDYTYEVGADSVLAAKPATRDLCARLGIADRLYGASARGAYVYRAGRLRRLPAGLSGLMPTQLRPLATSGILSPRGLARVALEPWRSTPEPTADESIRAFVVRRMGREAYDRLVEPLLTGIYAGDGAQLSIESTFPQLRAIERSHGSLLRGLRARAAAAAPAPGAASPSPFLSLPTGLAELIDALERALLATGRVRILRGTPVRALDPAPDGRWTGSGVRVVLDAFPIDADAVIVATPASVAASLLRPIDPALAGELAGVTHGSTATVTLAYALADVPRPLDGTGYVVPRAEGRVVMACTWLSSKWAGRVPADVALFRLFLGGAPRPELAHLDQTRLVALARTELREVLGVAARPRFTRVARWIDAMPQYTLGHAGRVARAAARVAAHPWLALAGNTYQGVGIPDCIRSGQAAADRVLAARRPAPVAAAA